MAYFITDQDNKDWLGRAWGENVSHEETNTNYYHATYSHPLIACFLYPAYESVQHPKIWTCEGSGETKQDGIRTKYSKLTTLAEIEFTPPTPEQCVCFALLCAMNLISNPTFKVWALNYLKNIDQTPQTAKKTLDILMDGLCEEASWLKPEYEYFAPAHCAIAAVAEGPAYQFAAYAGHRAWHDSLEFNNPLDLAQIGMIVSMLPAHDIARLLES